MQICSDGGLFAASAAASAVSRRLDRISSSHAPASRRLFGRKRSRNKGSAVPGGERAPALDETALQIHTPSTCKPKAAGSSLLSFTCISSPPYVRTCLHCCAAAVLSGEAEEIAKASVARNSSAAAEAAYHIAATPFKVPRHICTARRQLCHLSGMQDNAVAECLTTTFQPGTKLQRFHAMYVQALRLHENVPDAASSPRESSPVSALHIVPFQSLTFCRRRCRGRASSRAPPPCARRVRDWMRSQRPAATQAARRTQPRMALAHQTSRPQSQQAGHCRCVQVIGVGCTTMSRWLLQLQKLIAPPVHPPEVRT